MFYFFEISMLIEPFDSVYDVVQKIGTPLSLIAFIVATVYGYFRYRDVQKRKMLEGLEDSKKIQGAEIILDTFHIDISDMKPKQKYDLAMQKLKDKAKHRMTISVLLGFLGVLALIAVLFFNPKDENNSNSIENVGLTNYETTDYQVFIKIYKDSIAKRTMKDNFEHRNDFCKGARPVDWKVNADKANGWLIDVASINVSHTARSNCTFSGIFDKSVNGYSIRGVVRNSGKCVKVLGEVVSKDSRGKITAHYTHIETKKIRKIVEYEDEIKGKIESGTQVEIIIPENTASYTILLRDKNNEIIELSENIKEQKNYSVTKVGETKLILQATI